MPSPSLVGFEQRVVVGIAEMAVTNNQTVTLATYSLGSCLGIAIYDPVIKVGGLLHIMLPESSIDPSKGTAKPAMFVDTGVPALFRAVYQLRGEKYRLIVTVAGGAQVMDTSGFFNIGKRNFESLKSLLQNNAIRIHASEVGGLVSRSMFLNVATGEVRLKISGQPNDFILCKSSTST
ncbi:MAG TPA: chemotaxis protein CheD [Candidatus Paceibacterota bacterium]|nr:chemotaxis protein CheD [Verrucomicrobiota bacterium]HRY50294.1 chemotaxis protein CheD [Candidatus Paceibacterota bacterium]